MSKKLVLKVLLIIGTGIILISILFGAYSVHRFYNSIFRLSSEQVSDLLSKNISECQKISDCKLVSGDILIRRYITSQTWSLNEFVHPYFTHSAFYLGNDQIVEAVGTEKNHKNEVQISTLSQSDWMDNGIESFVIIRPKYNTKKLDQIKINLIAIANDPSYRFGLPKSGLKQTTCADLILDQLLNEKIIATSNLPKIITPDYLFWLAMNNPDNFEIIGYSK